MLRTHFRQRLRWSLSAGLVILLSVLLLRVDVAQAVEPMPLAAQFGGNTFTSDLTVAAGDRYEGDVTVLSGSVLVQANGVIEGDLMVLSGNIDIQEGSEVGGDVAALSGNIRVAGRVEGDVAAMSGNIDLAASAIVEGDVSVVNGDLQRAPGAVIEGQLVRGRGFPFSGRFTENPETESQPRVELQRDAGGSFLGWLGLLIFRLVLAVLTTGGIVAVVGVLHNLRPEFLQPIYTLMLERTAYSFIVGFLVNLVLAGITSGLLATLILCLGGIATGLILLVLNLVGWAVVMQAVGERLNNGLKTSMRPLASTVLAALLLTGLVALLWALGGCFRFFGVLLWLLLSSAGVGAALVHWLKLGGSGQSPTEPAPEPAGPQPNAPTGEPPVDLPPAAERESSPETRLSTEPPVDVPVDVAAPTPTLADPPVDLPPAAERETSPETRLSTEPPLDVPVEIAAPSEHAQPATELPSGAPADFTVLRGIGPALTRRLQAAGVVTFADLAGLTPDELARILGWSPERVIAEDLLGQARRRATL